MAPRAIITGAAGLIGQYLVKSAPRWAPGWAVEGLTRAQLDLTDQSAVSAAFERYDPRLIIHCAALSRTKECEQDPVTATRVNVGATGMLSRLARNTRFVFLSSGEVFDGSTGWYDEAAKPNPINVYGRTKLEAERLVLENPAHTVVRIVLTAGTSQGGDRSFVEDMCRTAKAAKNVTLYTDEFRCPLPAGVIARALWELVQQDTPGLYHLGGSERLSRWEIGELLLPWFRELKGRLIRGTARDHKGAPRPTDLSLSCEKIQNILSFRVPGLRSWLRERAQRGRDLWDYEVA
ncbi:MAG TPA: SDR family oxidoreductase [Nitrospira sp.]|nr:SDR family oxidoreductase [Nitrospira sp.]